MTGVRIGMAANRYLGRASHFAVTYDDGVCDADLEQECEFHKKHGKIDTVLGIGPPSRFGEFTLDDGDLVTEFSEKPADSATWINGGFFFSAATSLTT